MLMWSSVAASGFGDRMIQLAAWPLLGMNEPDAEAASIQAGVTFWFFLPFLILGPVGGYLADTFRRKWIMLGCDEGRALVLAGAAAVLWFLAPGYAGERIPDDHELADFAVFATLGVVAMTGALAGVFGPARDATVPQIVPLRQLQGANAIILAIATIASLIGLGFGGWIIDEYSVLTALTLGMACFLISGGFWAFIKPREHVRVTDRQRDPEWLRLVKAAGYVRRHPRLQTLFGLSIMFWGLSGFLLGSVAALCKMQYDLPREQLISSIAIMQASLGGGMLLSSVFLAWRAGLREANTLMMASVFAAGLCTLGLWMTDSYNLALVLAFLLGGFANVLRVGADSLTQACAANYIRGRVFGLREILTTGALLVSNFIVWRLPGADTIMIAALLPLGALLLVVGAIALPRILVTGPFEKRRVNAFWRFVRIICVMWHKLQWRGVDRVPREGAVILASNHTTGLDPFLIQSALPRLVRWVMTTSYRFRLLEPMWKEIHPICLDLDGRDLSELRELIREIKKGGIVGLFPEGRLQRDERGLGEFRAGIGLIARRTGATIVPVWIDGTPRKRNMLWHFLWPSNSRVTFGEPYVPDREMSNEEIAADLRSRMLALGGMADPQRSPAGRA